MNDDETEVLFAELDSLLRLYNDPNTEVNVRLEAEEMYKQAVARLAQAERERVAVVPERSLDSLQEEIDSITERAIVVSPVMWGSRKPWTMHQRPLCME